MDSEVQINTTDVCALCPHPRSSHRNGRHVVAHKESTECNDCDAMWAQMIYKPHEPAIAITISNADQDWHDKVLHRSYELAIERGHIRL